MKAQANFDPDLECVSPVLRCAQTFIYSAYSTTQSAVREWEQEGIFQASSPVINHLQMPNGWISPVQEKEYSILNSPYFDRFLIKGIHHVLTSF